MNTSARTRANRRNAKKSTGPRTVAGKQRTAGNALRHGLAVPIAVLPEFDAMVTALVRRIAGENPSTSRADLARRVAEAQVDLQRVRAAKLLILNGSIRIAPRPTQKDTMALAAKALDRDADFYPAMEGRLRLAYTPGETGGEPKPAARLADPTNELAKLDPYERRALSRRKFAVRAFDGGAAPD